MAVSRMLPQCLRDGFAPLQRRTTFGVDWRGQAYRGHRGRCHRQPAVRLPAGHLLAAQGLVQSVTRHVQAKEHGCDELHSPGELSTELVSDRTRWLSKSIREGSLAVRVRAIPVRVILAGMHACS